MTRNLLSLALLFGVLVFLHSCESAEIEQATVARVGENSLLKSDITASIPDDLSSEDSAELAATLIQTWMMSELMFDRAKYNLGEEQKGIEKQVASYRKDLFIFAYEKELVIQKLDTNISDEEISAFYKENADMFQLNDYILKVAYVKLRPGSPDLLKVKKWMQSDDEKDQELLMDYCQAYAVKCFTDTQWVYFNELLRELPIQVYNKEAFLRSGNLVDFRDTDHLYYLLIRDIQSKNTLSPLNFERKRIQNLILNKRKIELLNTIRRNIYRDAVSNGKAETYASPTISE